MEDDKKGLVEPKCLECGGLMPPAWITVAFVSTKKTIVEGSMCSMQCAVDWLTDIKSIAGTLQPPSPSSN